MPIIASDIQLWLTGGASNATPALSLGGVTSTTTQVSATPLNNVWRDDRSFETAYPLATVTISNATPAVVGWTGHGLPVGQMVVFLGTLPAGLTAGTAYFIITAGFTANAFEVSATKGGAAINTTTAGTAPFTAQPITIIHRALQAKNNHATLSLLNADAYIYAPTTQEPYEEAHIAYDTGTQSIADEFTAPSAAAMVWYSDAAGSDTMTVNITTVSGVITVIALGATPGTAYALGDCFSVGGTSTTLGYGMITAMTTPTSGIPSAVALIVGKGGTGYNGGGSSTINAQPTTTLVANSYATGIPFSTADLAAQSSVRLWERRTFIGSQVAVAATDTFTLAVAGETGP